MITPRGLTAWLDLQAAIPNAQTMQHNHWWVEAAARASASFSGGRVASDRFGPECCEHPSPWCLLKRSA